MAKKLTRSEFTCPTCKLALARVEDKPGTYICQRCGVTYVQEGTRLRMTDENREAT